MSIIQVSGQPQQVWAQSADTTLYNLDQVNSLWVGTTSSPDVPLSPLGAFVLEGGSTYWIAVSDGTGNQGGYDQTGIVVQVAMMVGLKGAIASPADIAAALVGSDLATEIAEAIVGSGIPITGNPILLYDVGGGGAPGQVGLFGCTNVLSGSYNGTMDQAIKNWGHNVGRTIQCRKLYFSLGEGFPTWAQLTGGQKAYFQACIDENVQAWICYNPNANPVTPSDGAAMVTSLNSFVAQGVPIRGAVFIQENWQFGAGGPNGPQPWMTAANFKSIYQTHYPTLHAAGYLVAVDFGGQEPLQIPNWDPGAAFYDVVAVDYYFGNFKAGKLIDTTVALATAGNKPLGVFEMGNSSAAGSSGPPQQTVIDAINYLATTAGKYVDAGGQLDAWMWYQVDGGTGPNIITTTTDYRDVPLQNLANVVEQVGTPNAAATTIAAGATLTLQPLEPSPNAGYASADGLSYDFQLIGMAGASSTNPFVTVTLTWWNEDDPNARRVDRQKYHLPLGNSTGSIIAGKGPQSGQFVSVTVKNEDSVSCQIQVQMNSTARNVLTHHWYWDSASSVAIPTFNSVGGTDFADSLGSLASQSIPASGSKSWLLSLFQGEVWFRAHADAGGFVTVQLQAQPTNAFGTGNMLTAQLPAPPGEYDNIVVFPRGPVQVTFTNSDTIAHVISMQVNSLEAS